MPNDVAVSSDEAMKVAVLLCGDLANPGTGLNLEELPSSLEGASPGISVEVVPDLCHHLGQLSSVAARLGAARAVLGLCSGEYSQIELQARARKAGLDPFGLEVIPLGTLCAQVHPKPEATLKAKILLSAAVARAQAFPGSGPEHATPYFLPRDQKVTRRSLFTVPPIGYRPVPSVRAERCAVQSGCQLCVQACPRNALEKTGGHLAVDKPRCEGCGVCLAVCPLEAFNFPGWSIAQFEAQFSALFDSLTHQPFGLLLTCQRVVGKLEELAHQGISYSHQWLPVVVPCLGMVTPTWLLQSLAHGAEVVALLFCGGDCPFGQEGVIGGRVNFSRQLLRRLGQAPERVRILSASPPERLLQALQKPPSRNVSDHQSRLESAWHLGSLEGAVQAIQFLGAGRPSSEVVLEHPYSPFGALELRAEGCTGCLSCVKACPTGALASESSGDEVTITYEASSCTGCELCVNICPEAAAQVLRVRRMTNLNALSGSRLILHKEQMAICEGCGATIASRTMLQRLETLLEGSDETLRTALSRYCPSCRLSSAWGARPSPVQRGEGK